MKLEFSDGTSRIEDRNFDPFFVGFNSNLFLRECCYRCKYCGQERIADITIGDYWGVEPDSIPQDKMRLGVSLVLANSRKGKRVLNEITDSFYHEKIDPDIAVSHNLALIKPNNRPKGRDKFYVMMENKGFNRAVKGLMAKYYMVVNLRKILIQMFGETMFERVRMITRKKNNLCMPKRNCCNNKK